MRLRVFALLLPALLLGAQSHESRLQKGEGYALVDGNRSMSMGDSEALKAARQASAGFWFRKEGKTYVVKDTALIAAARAAVEPMSRLGGEQGRLGGEQGRLGAKQGRLGAEQGRLGARMAGASAKEMEALGAQMKELGQQQEALGREQEALGAQQRELGRQQEAASEAAIHKLRSLRDQALTKGLAQAL